MAVFETGDGPRRPPRGWEAIDEATRLLRRVRFSAQQGAYAAGRHVSVAVDPRWNDDGSVRVHVTCYAFGRRRVDWVGLPIFVLPDRGDQGGCVARLNARGQALISHLAPGEYRLSGSARWQVGDTVISEGFPAAAPEEAQPPAGTALPPLAVLPAARATASLAAAEAEEGLVAPRLDRPRLYETPDGKVRATLVAAAGTLEVAFETEAAELAGAQVLFVFAEAQVGDVALQGQVTLAPSADAAGLWEGVWRGPVSFAAPSQLVFHVVPPENGGEQ